MTTTTTGRRVRAAIYVRMSKDRIGAGLGVQRQEQDCRLLAVTLGWDVVTLYVDNDMSAYTGKPRKQYLAMLAAIEAGQVDAVIAWHTDRLHRAPAELERYITVCEPRGVPTHCVKAGILDLATPAGRLVARQLGAVARYESEHMAERTTAQKRAKRAQGARLGGGRPFGYDRDGLTVREDEADLIRDAVRRVLAGGSLRGIALDWNRVCPRSEWTGPMVNTLLDKGADTLTDTETPLYAEARSRVDDEESYASVACDWTDRRIPTGKRWEGTTVRLILCNPRNAGLIFPLDDKGDVVWTATPVTAKWPKIISEDEWRAVRAKMADPTRVTHESNSLRWIGSGFYRCGACGGASDMRNAGTSTWNGTPVANYRCRQHGHCSIQAEPVDALVHRRVRDMLTRNRGALLRAKAPSIDVTALRARKAAFEALLRENSEDYADLKIPKDEYLHVRDRVTPQIDAIERELAETISESPLTGIADADDPAAAYDTLSPDRQREIASALVSVTIAPARRGGYRGAPFNYDRIVITPVYAEDMAA